MKSSIRLICKEKEISNPKVTVTNTCYKYFWGTYMQKRKGWGQSNASEI